MTFSERRSILLRILEIDSNIKNIQQSKSYRRLKNDLKILSIASRGDRVLYVHSPENMDDMVEMSRSSRAIDEYIGLYKDKLKKDDEHLDELSREKVSLERSLFSANSQMHNT